MSLSSFEQLFFHKITVKFFSYRCVSVKPSQPVWSDTDVFSDEIAAAE